MGWESPTVSDFNRMVRTLAFCIGVILQHKTESHAIQTSLNVSSYLFNMRAKLAPSTTNADFILSRFKASALKRAKEELNRHAKHNQMSYLVLYDRSDVAYLSFSDSR